MAPRTFNHGYAMWPKALQAAHLLALGTEYTTCCLDERSSWPTRYLSSRTVEPQYQVRVREAQSPATRTATQLWTNHEQGTGHLRCQLRSIQPRIQDRNILHGGPILMNDRRSGTQPSCGRKNEHSLHTLTDLQPTWATHNTGCGPVHLHERPHSLLGS